MWLQVAPEDWDDAIADDDVLLLDTRNGFESALGTFSGSVLPPTGKFSEFPNWCEDQLLPHRSGGGQDAGAESRAEGGGGRRHRRVAMFCTGGIRCEKASAYLLQYGGYAADEVMQLKGGIQSYLTHTAAAAAASADGNAAGGSAWSVFPSFSAIFNRKMQELPLFRAFY